MKLEKDLITYYNQLLRDEELDWCPNPWWAKDLWFDWFRSILPVPPRLLSLFSSYIRGPFHSAGNSPSQTSSKLRGQLSKQEASVRMACDRKGSCRSINSSCNRRKKGGVREYDFCWLRIALTIQVFPLVKAARSIPKPLMPPLPTETHSTGAITASSIPRYELLTRWLEDVTGEPPLLSPALLTLLGLHLELSFRRMLSSFHLTTWPSFAALSWPSDRLSLAFLWLPCSNAFLSLRSRLAGLWFNLSSFAFLALS